MACIAVVVPVFNEDSIIEPLVARLAAMANAQTDHTFEFIMVEDGSWDETYARLKRLQQVDPRLTLVKLSRNWGHQCAYNAGLDAVDDSADAVVLMDGDLEDPPELIPTLIAHWQAGNQIVYTVKENRIDSPLRKLMFSLYYRVIRIAADIKIDKQAGMFSLLDIRAARQLRRFGERNKSYPNLRAFIGFRQVAVPYRRQMRASGTPKQTLSRLINDGLNALFAFSFLPLRLMTFIGLAMVGIFGFLSAAFLIVRIADINFWVFRTVPGWTSAMLTLLLIASIQIVFIGILGEYVSRIFDEVRQRPYYIVDRIERGDSTTSAEHHERTRP